MDMTASRSTEEQIFGILREQEAGDDGGYPPRARISSAMLNKWEAKYGGLEVSDARRLTSDRGRQRRATPSSSIIASADSDCPDSASYTEQPDRSQERPIAQVC
jgi:hypothetical protein